MPRFCVARVGRVGAVPARRRRGHHPRAAGRKPTATGGEATRPGSRTNRAGRARVRRRTGGRRAAAKEGGTAGPAPQASSLRQRPDVDAAPKEQPRREQRAAATRPSRRRSTCRRWSARSSPSGTDAKTFDASLAQTEGGEPLDVLRGPADRQRQARRAPRRGPRLQGRLPAVQDHAGLPRGPQGRLGLPRPARRDRGREGARLHRQGRHRGLRRRRVQREVPRVGAAARRRVRGDDRADGLLGRHADDPYRTMDPAYVQSVWWSLKQIFDKGLLAQDHRVAPYCPRCGTGLSDHELAQGYETVVDPSVYVRFPLTSGPYAGTAALLVWTTTPWTLVSNTAVAVRPDVTYVTATQRHARPWSSPSRWSSRPWATGGRCSDRFAGTEMERWTYERPFDLRRLAGGRGTATSCVLADYVTTEDGTGLVHQSPAFGAEDLAVSRAYGLPGGQPGPAGRALRGRRCGWSAASSSSTPTRRWCSDLEETRHAVPAPGLRARLPALLALPHRAALLRPALLVRPHDRRSRTRCSPRTSAPPGTPRTSSGAATATGCTTTSTGRCPAAATGARRCPIWRCDDDGPATWSASGRWPSSASWPARTWRPSTRTGRTSTT